jgi:hypothetical protein
MALSRQELVARVKRLLSGEWNNEKMEASFGEIHSSVPCPFAKFKESFSIPVQVWY